MQLSFVLTSHRYITIQFPHRQSRAESSAESIYSTDRNPWPTRFETDTRDSLWHFLRTFEASVRLHDIHNAVHSPTADRTFHTEEMGVLVGTSSTLRTLLVEEIEDENQIYSGGLVLCQM